jgi:phosphoenolpyruvate phosphomutase
MVDADTGYGNFNNARRLVCKLEQRGIAAMCIEDKLFPKINSFISSEQQVLASIEEFTGKIKAAKDSQKNPDFCVVARTEAFIVGQGLAEALKRAEAYRRAGADGVLIHSKSKTSDQILAFMQEWGNACPVVIVPTTYYQTDVRVFEEAGISMVIWANHLLRASIRAMQQTAEKLFRGKSLAVIEPDIVTVAEVFRLQNVEELNAAEKRYLPV